MEQSVFQVSTGLPSAGILFVDHQKCRRSGHLGHAMVEYADGQILCFYPNNSASLNHGHNGYGWVEIKRSTDGGETWSGPEVLPYSWEMFLEGRAFVCCEKAVLTDQGTIVLNCLLSLNKEGWEPYEAPVILRSTDGGRSWLPGKPLCSDKGRTYDMRYRDGKVYAYHFANDGTQAFYGTAPEHKYQLWVSEDDGETFSLRSVLPFDTNGLAYGVLQFLPDGRMIAYAYNIHDEYHMTYAVSDDDGRSWSAPAQSYVAKRIRNPQISCLDGLYFLHGRSGCMDDRLPKEFVLYTSVDAIHWDEGQYLRISDPDGWGGWCYYSNSIVTGLLGEGKHRLLIQASDSYEKACTNIRHWWIER